MAGPLPVLQCVRMNSILSARRGFSLIELMIVVAVVAVLALLAMPSFTDRIVRKQVAETLPVVEFAKQNVALFRGLSGKFPVDNTEASLPPADKIVGSFLSSVTVRDGVLVLVFGNGANPLLKGKQLALRPAYVPDYPQVPLVWVCAGAAVPDQMQVHGTDSTDIPALYLPLACRPGAAKKA